MFFGISYNILGIICLFILVWLVKQLLTTLRNSDIAPIPLKTKVLCLLLGALIGFTATIASFYAGLAIFFMLGIPTGQFLLMALVYFVACFSFALAYGLSKIIGFVYRRSQSKFIFYSALIVSVYFTLHPIGYNWLLTLFTPLLKTPSY